MYRSATVKLTVWYLALVMAISLAFSGVVYHFASSELATGLSRQTQRIYREFPVFSGDPFFRRDTDAAIASHNILRNLLYVNVGVLIVAGAASYWLAKRTLRPIEESNESQKRFVADASHELRTPVTALKMDAEVALLDKNASKDELRAALTSTVEEADKLDVLLNNLLRLSQLESDDIRQSFTNLSVGTILEATVKSISPQADAKHITIDNTVTEAIVSGDFDSLKQLFIILLDNAIKYSPEKSTIIVSSKADAHAAIVTVRDEGIGIAPDALAHVFDRFYRADKARTSKNGFGLGLSIAKHIADLHQGTVTLSSTVGKGTKVTVSLPLAG
jgi:signal transduction histidine kinase